MSQASCPTETDKNKIEWYYRKHRKKKINKVGKSLKSERSLGVKKNHISIFNCYPRITKGHGLVFFRGEDMDFLS